MNWTNLLILLALMAGHAELMVTSVNRLYARRLRCGTLRRLRHIHDVMIVLFPLLLVWFVGLRGPRLLAGGSWAAVPAFWWPIFGLCAAGFLGLCFCALREALSRIPGCQLSNDSRTVDVEQRLGFRPVGAGPHRLLTRVPGNEIFRLQVSEKTYRIPGLPPQCDGLSILHISDLHFIGTLEKPFFEEVIAESRASNADLIIFTGDLLDDMRYLDWLPETLGRLSAPLGCHFILGNHDWYLEPETIRAALLDLGWQDMAGKTVVLDCNLFPATGKRKLAGRAGSPVVLAGTERPWIGEHPDFSGVPADAFKILLSHTPDNLPWAQSAGVDLMLSGHNHGGQVKLPLVGPVYSPSRHGVRYAGGVFQAGKTLLYVSRGISGRHPLRIGSPPELTKLILRSPA